MFMDIGAAVRVGADLGLQPIDIPEFGRRRMGVEQIVDAERGAPARRESIVRIEIQLPEALAVDLTESGRRIGAGGRHAREIMHGGGVDAGSGRERIIAEIAIVQTATPGPEIRQIQGQEPVATGASVM